MEPLRPSDYDDGSTERPIQQPALGLAGFGRFMWRQLTSMRTALILLLLLALASIPGSLVPQRSSDPNGVVQFR
ncbi:MAG: cytochrome c biogenesis protein ResB, partial [Pontimonas sp.]|nr:cytochrome c biogenesis protein ResB [Pontimonas sp.]